MAASRLATLKDMVAQNPDEFRSLIEADPDYVPAYFHGGQTLEKLGREDEARAVYRNGLEAAGRKGDQHAQAEIAAALELLG